MPLYMILSKCICLTLSEYERLAVHTMKTWIFIGESMDSLLCQRCVL